MSIEEKEGMSDTAINLFSSKMKRPSPVCSNMQSFSSFPRKNKVIQSTSYLEIVLPNTKAWSNKASHYLMETFVPLEVIGNLNHSDKVAVFHIEKYKSLGVCCSQKSSVGVDANLGNKSNLSNV